MGTLDGELDQQEIQQALSPMRGTLPLPVPYDEDVFSENDLIEQREAFAVTDFGSADWVVSKVQAARRYREDVKRFAEGEIKKADDAERFYLGKYRLQLQQLVEQTTASVKKKSIQLVSGRLQLRKTAVGLEVKDADQFTEWVAANTPTALTSVVTMTVPGTVPHEFWASLDLFCKTHGVSVETVPKIDKAKVNAMFKATGETEVPDGCVKTGGKDEVYIQ